MKLHLPLFIFLFFVLKSTGQVPPAISPYVATNSCPATTVNLNNLIDDGSPGEDNTLVWSTNYPPLHANDTLTTVQADAVGNGKYYAYYRNSVNGAFSDPDTLNVIIEACGCADIQIRYTLDIPSTLSNNVIAANGGSANLYFNRTSGPPIPGMADVLTLPLTYSDLNNTINGTDNQWSGFASDFSSEINYFVILPKADENSGGLYNNLPAKNKNTITTNLVELPNVDRFFGYQIRTGVLDVLGNVQLSFGNHDLSSLPPGISVYRDSLLVRQTGNIAFESDEENVDLEYDFSGYFFKPILQTDFSDERDVSNTNPFRILSGQTYSYWYTAFDDESYVPAGNGDSRGLGIYGSITFCSPEELLPITGLSFNVKRVGAHGELSWTTASEYFNKGFEVERSEDGIQWKSIGFVNSLSGPAGSSSILKYSFSDPNPLKGSHTHYRLKQIDIDGKHTYSYVRTIKNENRGGVQVYPIPTRGTLYLTGLSGGEQINVYDAAGRMVKQQRANGSQINMSLHQLNSGFYYLHVIGANGTISIHKVMKTQ